MLKKKILIGEKKKIFKKNKEKSFHLTDIRIFAIVIWCLPIFINVLESNGCIISFFFLNKKRMLIEGIKLFCNFMFWGKEKFSFEIYSRKSRSKFIFLIVFFLYCKFNNFEFHYCSIFY